MTVEELEQSVNKDLDFLLKKLNALERIVAATTSPREALEVRSEVVTGPFGHGSQVNVDGKVEGFIAYNGNDETYRAMNLAGETIKVCFDQREARDEILRNHPDVQNSLAAKIGALGDKVRAMEAATTDIHNEINALSERLYGGPE
jgi:hypothetical protein